MKELINEKKDLKPEIRKSGSEKCAKQKSIYLLL